MAAEAVNNTGTENAPRVASANPLPSSGKGVNVSSVAKAAVAILMQKNKLCGTMTHTKKHMIYHKTHKETTDGFLKM